MDLRFTDLRILIELNSNTLDVAPWLDAGATFLLGRSELSPNQASTTHSTFTLSQSYGNAVESFDYRINDRFKPGQRVTFQIYWEGQWRSPPFGATQFIKFSKPKNTGTHEIVSVETHDELSQRLEIDRVSDPERQYDALGNPVLQTRDVLGQVRSLGEICKSYFFVKGLTLTVPSGKLTQSTNASKEYWGDTSDAILNAAAQMVTYNPDAALKLNFLACTNSGPTVVTVPVDLSVVQSSDRLMDCTWGPYTNDLLIYDPEDETEQLAQYVEVTGVASRAIARESVVTTGGPPAPNNGFSFNTPVNPITSLETTTTFNWAGLTIEIDAKTYSTAQALKVSRGTSVGFGNTLVQQEVTKKIFDSRRRLAREEVKRYVPDALKLGSGSSAAIGTPAYQKEIIYNLSSNDRVLGQTVNETAANAITGNTGAAADLGILSTSGRNYQNLGQGVNISSGGMVASPSLAQGAVPYFPGSYGGAADNANAPQCDYFPDQYYTESTPLRRKVQLTWGAGTLTKQTKPIDVGSALLTGANFDLLAQSLAHLHTAQHTQFVCEFPMSVGLFTNWTSPGKIISILEVDKGKRFHYFTGADFIEFSAKEVKCKTNLFWIGTTTEATGLPDPSIVAVVDTFYLLDDDDDILTDEDGDRLTWM
jgi:hypothetical protein